MPALPDASYFAEGLLIISIASRSAEFIDRKNSERSFPAISEGLPSI